MLTALQGGMKTLLCSVLLLLVLIFMLAVVFRESLGSKEGDNVKDYFSSVPRAMFTVFRCSFGDCATSSGTPIFEHVTALYGWVFSMVYCVFTFVVSIGFFNVISAVFVQTSLSAALASEHKQQQDRLKDDKLWATRVTTFIRRVMEEKGYDVPDDLSEVADDILDIDIEGELFAVFVKDPVISTVLDDLDINPDDHMYLADILDPDNGGTVSIVDLLDGLMRLRGEPRRSDTVTIDLMVRSIQSHLKDIHGEITEK